MPEYTDIPPAREQAPTSAELMALHGSGSAHTPLGCSGTARCEPWRDAHLRDVMAGFWAKPLVVAALADAGHPNPLTAVAQRAE